MLSKLTLSLVAATVLAAGCTSPPRPTAFPDRPLDALSFDAVLLSRAVYSEVNRERASIGLPALGPSRELDTAADEQAAQLVLTANVGHANFLPGEETPRARVARVGLFPDVVGENALMLPLVDSPGNPPAASSYASFAALMVDGWMHSPGHRENILDPDFQVTGVATRLGRSPRSDSLLVYAVQVFIASEPAPRRPHT